ncbi:MAG: acetylglutamate kinase [Actinobacteria bacterium]|nr:acetylglutamate kinase [Actinomycetota bacterium]
MTRIEEALAKATVLVESLPYIRTWAGKTVVIKMGGETLEDDDLLGALATDVALMKFVGINPVVVHGGGPQISDAMGKLGKKAVFVGGQRVTDHETMEIVKMVLLGQINKRIVTTLNAQGVLAAGISGEDGNLITARKALGSVGEDLGFVGEVEKIEPAIVNGLISSDFVPVVAPVATGPDGSYNINADVAAGAIAGALAAQKIVFLTNVPGLYRDLGDEGSLISETTADQLAKLLADGVLSEGMIPKIASAVSAIKDGVPQAHILDGRVKHALLLEVFTDEGIGTMVTA